MGKEFYIQIEVQENAEGAKGIIPFAFDDYNEALAKHYSVLAAASKSSVPYHASFILASTGTIFDQRVFDRRKSEETEFDYRDVVE